MEKLLLPTHTGGIAMIAFVLAVAISIGYYQFVYIPEVNAKPILPEKVLNPPEVLEITIVQDAVLETNPDNFVPKEPRATLEINNKVIWTNNDGIGHTVTTDDGYVDIINGKFDSTEQLGSLVMPGKTFEFTFTKEGKYPYHCEPHPHMQGAIEVVPNFA